MSSDPILRRVLVIDDNGAIHDDFRKTLARQGAGAELADVEAELFGQPMPIAPAVQFDVDAAFQGQEGLERVRQAMSESRPYAMAFVDMRMPPGWDGVQTIENLWRVDPRLQVVICTAYSDYSWEQITQRLGSTDRLLILKKPFDGVEVCQLATALTEKWELAKQVNQQVQELESLVQQRTNEIAQAALRDKLTGLPNRELFTDRLAQALVRARRDSQRRFAVLFLDFDRFKVVNDSLGHEIGDLLLVSIAQRLREALRSADTIAHLSPEPVSARLGGDEFTVLLEDLREDADAIRVAERLLEVLAEPHSLKGHDVVISASIGIATGSIGYERAEDVLRDADTAMYRAKAAGTGRFVVFDQQMHTEAVARLTLENDLRKAVDRQELLLHYQPIVSLESGALMGFEALVRWQHPTRGLIFPDSFIPLAEETGLIVPIGMWVFEEACRSLARWHARFPAMSHLDVSINLSRRQLRCPDLIADVRRIIAATGVSPQQLSLEITESAVMEEVDASIALLEQLRAMGLGLALDDFGTGFSSLSCLHRFPLGTIKIDRAFVNHVSERRDYAAVVNAIIALAHNLDIQLIAEGVETAEQVALLQGLDCDQAQGYYFARPMETAAAEQFIARRPQILDTLRMSA